MDDALMNTTGGQVGNFVGLFVTAIAIPIVLLIVFKLIPAMRRRPAVMNGIPGLLAALIPFLAADTAVTTKVIVAALAGALFYWQYVRDLKALAKAESPPPKPSPR